MFRQQENAVIYGSPGAREAFDVIESLQRIAESLSTCQYTKRIGMGHNRATKAPNPSLFWVGTRHTRIEPFFHTFSPLNCVYLGNTCSGDLKQHSALSKVPSCFVFSNLVHCVKDIIRLLLHDKNMHSFRSLFVL